MSPIIQQVTPEEIAFFTQKAEEKIAAEGWHGRNKEQKKQNFVSCWLTEEAFKKLLIAHHAFFRHRALYVGDAAGAGLDFEIKRGDTWVSVGIRSIGPESAFKWKSVAYPEDRFLQEPEKIPDYVVACTVEGTAVTFFGIIDKGTLLAELARSERRRSRTNQEYFRTVPLGMFSGEKLVSFLRETAEQRE